MLVSELSHVPVVGGGTSLETNESPVACGGWLRSPRLPPSTAPPCASDPGWRQAVEVLGSVQRRLHAVVSFQGAGAESAEQRRGRGVGWGWGQKRGPRKAQQHHSATIG